MQRGNVKVKGQAPTNQEIKWAEEHQAVLEKLLNKLVSPPIIGFSDFDQSFPLHIDASQIKSKVKSMTLDIAINFWLTDSYLKVMK